MEVLYKNDDSRFSELEKNVVLPTFQRKLVWSKAQKKSFINTLHEGFPFGSILVYRYPDADKLSLIDGLQGILQSKTLSPIHKNTFLLMI